MFDCKLFSKIIEKIKKLNETNSIFGHLTTLSLIVYSYIDVFEFNHDEMVIIEDFLIYKFERETKFKLGYGMNIPKKK
jgi:hypothetical protein